MVNRIEAVVCGNHILDIVSHTGKHKPDRLSIHATPEGRTSSDLCSRIRFYRLPVNPYLQVGSVHWYYCRCRKLNGIALKDSEGKIIKTFGNGAQGERYHYSHIEIHLRKDEHLILINSSSCTIRVCRTTDNLEEKVNPLK